jgi:hypothetical protein
MHMAAGGESRGTYKCNQGQQNEGGSIDCIGFPPSIKQTLGAPIFADPRVYDNRMGILLGSPITDENRPFYSLTRYVWSMAQKPSDFGTVC